MAQHETETARDFRTRIGACAEAAGVVALAALTFGASAGAAYAAGGVKLHHSFAPRADVLSGVPLALLVAFAGAVLGALAAFAGRELRKAWSHHRGLLTGFWLWITYERGDLTMSRPVLSIELLQLKHHQSASGETIRGTAWRVFANKERSTWDRRWTLTGYAKDKFVECVYKSETGGGDGAVNMWKTKPGYQGEYIQAREAPVRGRTNDAIATEWARLPRELPQQLKQAIARIPAEDAEKYPRRVRRALGLSKSLRTRVLEQLPFAVAAVDNQLALQATLAVDTSQVALEEAEQMTIRRRELHLGEHAKLCRPMTTERSADAGRDLLGEDHLDRAA
ncbi:MAG TPA: hypothetical protein VH081_02830 [Solirubrobacteraceae bacterium]|jgi:hypothetical protein|nr:hypothetical protein [Solirubrobacteraceae bacterium]